MKKLLVLFLFFFTAGISLAQISGGSYSIPGTPGTAFATIKGTVDSLNAVGISGSVIFNVAAGYTESITAPITITATGTSSNTITFQKSGGGANPKITRTDGGTISNTTFAAHNDAIIQMNGTDYITFDAIDLAASNQGVEFGYYTFKTATNGSQNVTIKNCVITMTKGTSGLVMGIYISNGPTTTATGVTVTSEPGRNKNITIISNTIQNVHAGIYCRGSSASNFYDSLFVIGQASAGNLIQNFGGGSATTTYGVYFIYVVDPSVSFNNINNAGGGGSSHGSTLYGIFYSTVKGNVVGNDNEFTLANSSASSSTYYIYNSNDITSNTFNNNKFGAGTISSTGTVYLIYASSATNSVTVSGNSTTGTITRTGASGSFYCYYNSGGGPTGGTETLTNNTFSDISVSGTSSLYGLYSSTAVAQNRVANNNVISNFTGGTGSTYGMYMASSGTNQINDNNVYGFSAGGTIYGIYFSGTTPSVYNNNVYNLTTSGSLFYGIYDAGTGTTNCYKNRVYNLTGNNATQTLYGFYITTGTANYVYNNFVSDLKAPNSTNSTSFSGMHVTGGTYVGLYYNTIYLSEKNNSSTTFGSSGIYAGNTTPTTLDFRNNIVVNSSNSGNGTLAARTVAFRKGGTTYTNYTSGSSNNNDYYVDGGLSAKSIFFDGTNGDSTITDFKTRMNPVDGASFSENPPFKNASTPPYNLHIDTTFATQVESGGAPVTSPLAISDDYDGNVRNGASPDVGADEFDGIGADLTPPTFAYDQLLNTSLTTARTLVATITDGTGVPTSGAGMPRLYWQINYSGSYSSVSPSYLGSNQYQYSFGSGVTLGDTVYYYLVARDTAGTPNIGSSPSGASGFTYDPPAASTPPSSPNYYVIVNGFSGNYNVGSGQTYTTLTDTTGIFRAINNGAVAGNITITIVSNITEPGLVALNQTNDDGGGTYTITIKPDGTTERVLSGDVATTMIILNGADRVSFDGRFGGIGRYLRFRNINTSDPTFRIQNGATNNTIRNCYIEGAATSTADGVINFGAGDNTNNIILQCDIRDRSDAAGRPYVGIYFGNIANDGNKIMNCNVYDFNQYGIYLSTTTNTLIDSCNLYMNIAGSTTAYGIYLVNAVGTRIVKNKISGLTGGSSSSVNGIYYSGSTSRPVTCWIENNSISISPTTTGSVAGIQYIGSSSNSVYINYNSVYVGGTATSGTSYGIWINDVATDYWQYDNVVHNARSGGSGKHYGVYYDGSAITNLNMNYNDYYASGTSGYLGFWTSDWSTIGDWKTASNKDSNSLGSDPLFNTSTNLQPQTGSPVLGAGVPIAGITTDITNAARSGSTPSMGAWEGGGDFVGPNITYAALTNTSSTSNRTLSSVTITDATGVDWVNLPRIYFKKSTDANVFGGNTSTDNGWKWTTANVGSSPTNFTINYSIINGGSVSVGDYIQYFVVAQDVSVNVSANPSSGFVGTSVSSVSSAPTTPNQYKIVGAPLSGDYNIIVPPLKEFNQKFNRNVVLEKRTRKVMREVSVVEEVSINPSTHKDQTSTNLGTKNKSIENSDTPQQADLEPETNIVSSNKKVYTASDGSLAGVDVAEGNDSEPKTKVVVRYEKIEMDEEYYVFSENGIEVDWRTIVAGLEGFTETTYPSIQAAVTDLNERGISGAVRFLLGSTSYTETFPIVITEVTGASGTNTVTFKPDATITTSVSGTPAATAMFHLNGADYIIFDGSNVVSGTSRNWTLTNSSASIPIFRLENDATNNVIKNLILESQNTSSTSGAIVLLSTTGASGNSNDSIYNNKIKDYGTPYYTAIYSAGNTSARNANNSILNNEITNFTNYGVYVTSTGNGSNWTISDNHFYNSLTPSSSQYSIYLAPGIFAGGAGGHTIYKNFIGGSASNCGGTAWTNSGAVTFAGIYASIDTITSSTISDNTIQNISMTSTSSSPFTGINLVGGRATISGNIVGHSSTANSIQVAGSSTTHGIRTASTSYTTPIVITNNTVANMTASGTGTGVKVRGIMIDGTNIYCHVTNNTINNLSSASSGTGIAAGSPIAVGIYSWTGASNFMEVGVVISGNTIHTIQGTNTGAYASVVAGITATNYTGTTNKNKIYDIVNLSTGSDATLPPIAAGIFYRFCADSANAIDNFISLGSGQTNGNMFVGIIQVVGDAGNRLYTYYNSVRLSGTVTSGGLRTAAFQRGSNATTDTVKTQMFIKNNIFDNARSGGSAGHYAIANQFNLGGAIGWSSTASNYNILNSSSASTVGLWGTLDRTFTEWKSSSGGDGYSQSGITVNYSDIANGNLHLSGGSIGDGNLACSPITGITTDIDGDARNAYWPYMGADEIVASPLSLKLTLKALIQGIYANSGNEDTLVVYLTKPTSPYTKYIPVKGLTSSTGVDFYMPKTNNETSYYIAIKNRNSLETWSASTVATASFPLTFDMTSAQAQAFGGNTINVSGKWCIYNGDVVVDEFIDGSDVSACFNDGNLGASGYVITDLTGDDFVDGTDVSLAFNNSNLGVGAFYPTKKSLPTKVQKIDKQDTIQQ